MRKFFVGGLLLSGLLFLSSAAYAEYDTINIQLAFKRPMPKEVAILLDQLNVTLKQLKAYAEKINGYEETTKTHICPHDVGGACGDVRELTDEVFVKPTPTPK